MNTEDRLTALEERLAFTEDTQQKLDEALADQQKQLLSMERKVDLIMQQLKKLENQISESPQDERPPHY